MPEIAEMAELVSRFLKMGLNFEAAAELAAISRDLDFETIPHIISALRAQFEQPTE
ncbi:MAG: hypothetical protein VYD57_09095 [Pseudomonadota bacterium]|nr:hypothetical protein [Pseudomonadota bacterium]